MQRLKSTILTFLAIFSIGLAPVMVPAVAHATLKDELCKGAGGTGATSCAPTGETNTSLSTIIKNVVNILLFLVGAIAIIMIIIGGLKYVTSGGDSSSVTSAKNTVLYAVIGIVVAAMAYAIVNFVVTKL